MLARRDDPAPSETVSRRRYERERAARQQAEALLEVKSRELWQANRALAMLMQSLEEKVIARTEDLVTAREEAEAANQRKSDFVAHISHELRTPLNGVIAMADVLRHEVPDAGLRRMSDIILSSGEALLALLNDLLDLSKIEAGRMDLDPQPFHLRPFLERLCEIHHLRAQERGVEMVLTLADDLPDCATGDSHRIAQILHNLLSNAIKFSDHGRVTLAVGRTPAGQLSFEVADTGVGMTAEQLDRIFDRYEQADLTVARKYGGTGLGLAIVRDLVGMMAGQIAVTSTPGYGTCFVVSLPLPCRCDRGADDLPRRAPASLPDLTGLRCLAADDNGINREILAALMAPTGLALKIVPGGREAVRAYEAAQGAFDLLLFDMNMPGMDGPTALGVIRGIEAAMGRAPLPALALTAAVIPEERAALLAAGFGQVIAKPVKRLDLALALEQAVRRR